MTVDGAQIGLAATVAVTFTAFSVMFILRVYVRRRLAAWVCSDWLNVLTYGIGLSFCVLIAVGLGCGLGKHASFSNVSDSKKAASVFFWSQALALGSVGTGRLASAVLMGQVLEKQSEWRQASCMWSCLCGLWVVAEVMLATIGCGYDESGSRFVCPAETPRWVSITILDICLEVCLVVLWITLLWRLQNLPWIKRLELCATASGRLLVTPLEGGRLSAYIQFAGNNDGSNNSLRSTIIWTALLVMANIVTANLSVVTNMRRKPSFRQALSAENGPPETPSGIEQSSPKTDEELRPGHEELGERRRSMLFLSKASGQAATPERTMPLPPLPQGSFVRPAQPSQLPPRTPAPQSPLPQPPSPLPSRQSRHHSIKSRRSESTFAGLWDGRSTDSACSLVAPAPAWSSFD